MSRGRVVHVEPLESHHEVSVGVGGRKEKLGSPKAMNRLSAPVFFKRTSPIKSSGFILAGRIVSEPSRYWLPRRQGAMAKPQTMRTLKPTPWRTMNLAIYIAFGIRVTQ